MNILKQHKNIKKWLPVNAQNSH